MWSGIESDVQLFASGRVLHDDGEWAGGQTLNESSGSGTFAVQWVLAAASTRPTRHSGAVIVITARPCYVWRGAPGND